jgi:hypothetical protein
MYHLDKLKNMKENCSRNIGINTVIEMPGRRWECSYNKKGV